ncbi:glycosyl hydrolase [Blyttiomyces helicus]|uniref:Endo-1,5-alpha-L-arabinanase A n=1 Tax=Blyttiomyces helicus TaxID=388810 RepID=A0A4P9WDI8_9FUNG|nr:glycosyl hydrolase [Blyttiomyces helicus]|eukprot:RKO88416.1 glycosyl hydrolase [Blyttiomyces helicus]
MHFPLWTRTLATAALVSALPGTSPAIPDTSTFPLPGPVTGDPISTHTHDPAIIKFKGTYYLFATHNNISITTAPSMAGPWTRIGQVLEKGSIIDNAGRFDPWAPDVQEINGTFYLYYAVSTFATDKSSIGVATSTSLAPGTWTDHGAIITTGVPTNDPALVDTNAIDPNLFYDPSTRAATLQIGSFFSDIWQIPMEADLLAAGQSGVHLALDPVAPSPVEGSFLHRAANGFYYLYVSHGICCGYGTPPLPAPGKE